MYNTGGNLGIFPRPATADAQLFPRTPKPLRNRALGRGEVAGKSAVDISHIARYCVKHLAQALGCETLFASSSGFVTLQAWLYVGADTQRQPVIARPLDFLIQVQLWTKLS